MKKDEKQIGQLCYETDERGKCDEVDQRSNVPTLFASASTGAPQRVRGTRHYVCRMHGNGRASGIDIRRQNIIVAVFYVISRSLVVVVMMVRRKWTRWSCMLLSLLLWRTKGMPAKSRWRNTVMWMLLLRKVIILDRTGTES